MSNVVESLLEFYTLLQVLSAKLTQLSAFSLFVTKNNSFSLCVSKCGDDERSFSSQFWITHLMASVRHKITNQQKQLNESFHPSPTLSLALILKANRIEKGVGVQIKKGIE